MSEERNLWWTSLGVLVAVGVGLVSPCEGADTSVPSTAPVWTTSSRLLKLGESLEFKFRLPPGVTSGGINIWGFWDLSGRKILEGSGRNWLGNG